MLVCIANTHIYLYTVIVHSCIGIHRQTCVWAPSEITSSITYYNSLVGMLIIKHLHIIWIGGLSSHGRASDWRSEGTVFDRPSSTDINTRGTDCGITNILFDKFDQNKSSQIYLMISVRTHTYLRTCVCHLLPKLSSHGRAYVLADLAHMGERQTEDLKVPCSTDRLRPT